jgi:hypothetical protein
MRCPADITGLLLAVLVSGAHVQTATAVAR